jgi:hypothetical protein
VRLLLAAHAVVDKANSNGGTPLMAACNKGHGDCVKLLVHAGARTDCDSLRAQPSMSQRPEATPSSQDSKTKQAGASEARASVASALAAASGSAKADDEVLAAADNESIVGPAPSAAADEALRVAMAAAQYEDLIGAIEEHHALASEGVLAEARAMRERLHKKRRQQSQKLRRKHAARRWRCKAARRSCHCTRSHSRRLPQA